MMLKLLAILLALVFHAISSVPVDTHENTDSDAYEEQGEPNQDYVIEIQRYFEEQNGKNPTSRNARQTTNSLSHGDTIAIQTFRRDQWLSCSGLHCGSQGCPGVLFDTDDWRRCWGEVFRIYRAAGPGQIRVGDLVGIYYLNEDGRWLGCAGPYCAKATCPGRPTTENGFASRDHWYRCWGEVFRIYANDKNDTTVINYGDNIMLYYMSGHSWISQGYLGTEKKSCPGSLHPPQHDKFDRCSWEVFLFWKQ